MNKEGLHCFQNNDIISQTNKNRYSVHDKAFTKYCASKDTCRCL